MGEVYRAKDTKLKREVALKVLPVDVSTDRDRLARFQREAEVLASLNHPHIAQIYGLEQTGDTFALVMELVEGEDLAQRIARGPLAIDEALPIARQIAEALEAAHDHSIIHRDLKPANVKVRPDGTVKVLDFGLAKAIETGSGVRGPGSADAMNSPTLSIHATQSGIILGTAAYMSPEQARGNAVDKRTDVWAFGCVLYELLTGRRAFPGQTTADSLAAILEREPDWNALPAATPTPIRHLVQRCLAKDAKRRLRDIGDARIELDEALSHPRESGLVTPAYLSALVVARGGARERVAWAIAALCLVGLVVTLAFGRAGIPGRTAVDTRVYQSSIVLPEGLRLAGQPAGRFALSPDGRRLAFVASDATGRPMLWVRRLDMLIAQPLSGTEGAAFPFWSPDSAFVAFLAQGKLKKVEVAGGSPATVCDAAFGAPGAWSPDDVILFTPKGGSSLYRVSASGGTPSPVTMLDAASGESQHSHPVFLPDGRHFFYLALGSKAGGVTDPRAVYVGSLDPREPRKLLLQGGSNAKYSQGYLIFLRQSTLMAQAFDLSRLELRGEAAPLVENTQLVSGTVTGAIGAFTVSETGALVYQTDLGMVRSELVWFDRAGKQVAVLGDRADYVDVSLSPDSARAAVTLRHPERGTLDLWLYDVARGLRERFTVDPGDEFAPAWSLDGARLVFSARRQTSIDLYQKASSGAGAEERLMETGLGQYQASWSPDGQHLVYVAGGGAIGRSDLWVLPLFGERKPFPFLETTSIETNAQFSPDGRWIVYAAGEFGRLEVYVLPFHGRDGAPPSGKRVSTAGGSWPRWRRDGREVVYLAPDNTLVSATVNGQAATFEVGDVRPLFKVQPRPYERLDAYPYDISSDGQRFLVNTLVDDTPSGPITLVVNWATGLKQ